MTAANFGRTGPFKGGQLWHRRPRARRARRSCRITRRFRGPRSAPRSTTRATTSGVSYGENLWAAVKGYLDAVAETAAAPVIEKYTGVLGAVDVFTVPTAFSILESIRLDLGYRMDVHP